MIMANNNDPIRRKRSVFAKLFFCCKSSRLGRSAHFHAPAEDSVHVMITHDIKKNHEKGVPQKGYSARKPLSAILGQENQGSIQATEDDIVSNIVTAQ